MSTKRLLSLFGIAISIVFGVITSFFKPSYTISTNTLPESISLVSPVTEAEAGKVVSSDIAFHGDPYCAHNIDVKTSDPAFRAALTHDNKLVFMSDKLGEYDVTVYSAFDPAINVTQHVKIVAGEEVEAYASLQKQTIAIGEKTKIDWYVYPFMECTPTFHVFNSSIATIDDNGILTGVASGSTFVTVTIEEANYHEVVDFTVTSSVYSPSSKPLDAPEDPLTAIVGQQCHVYEELAEYGTSFEVIDTVYVSESNRGYIRPFHEDDFNIAVRDLNSNQIMTVDVEARKSYQRTLHPCLTAWNGHSYEFYYIGTKTYPEYSYFLSYGVGSVYETYLDQFAPEYSVIDTGGTETATRHLRMSENKYLQTEQMKIINAQEGTIMMNLSAFFSYPLNYRYIQFYNALSFAVLTCLAPLCLAAVSIWTFGIEKHGRYVAIGTAIVGLTFPFLFWKIPITLERVLTYYIVFALIYVWHFARLKIFYRTRMIDDEYRI